eukprot:gene12927-27270_t
MEAKNDSKWENDNETVALKAGDDAASENPGKSLVMRMCEYAFKVLNFEMEDFFDKYVDLFDQEEDDLNSGRGETMEQYNVFKKYEGELEIRFDDFAVKEGFKSAQECFVAVQEAVSTDLLAQKKMMEQLLKRLQQAQLSWANQIQNTPGDEDDPDHKAESKVVTKGTKRSGAASKDLEEDTEVDDETKGESAPIPMMMFFQPMSLESIVQTTLSIADYRTFSFIMRMKCRQMKLVREIDAKVRKQTTRTPERKKLLNATRNLNEIYEELIDRICGLTPNREDIVQETRLSLPLKTWENLMDEDISDENTKNQCKRIFTALFHKLAQMSSIEEMQAMRKYSSDMILAIDVMDGTTRELGARCLQTCHDFIDRIEKKISEILHAQKDLKNDSTRAPAKVTDDDEDDGGSYASKK